MQQNILEDSLCYLIGPIDNVDDCGSGWRKKFISLCKLSGLHIKFLDPTSKVTGLQNESSKERQLIWDMKSKESWDELTTFMRRIVREDHRSVDLSDFVVVHLEPSVQTCGSYFELQSALTQKKPYFIVIKGGKSNIPAWLFGICDHNRFFDSTESVIEELVSLNEGLMSLSDRWVLFRNQIKDL